MDRKYIEAEHIIERYLAGELTVREAREFEQYCADNPAALKEMPIPVRLKTRLSRRPSPDSETGVFQAIPSSVTRAALEATEDDDFESDEGRSYSSGAPGGVNRKVALGLAIALIAAAGAAVAFAMQSSALSKQLQEARRETNAMQMRAPAGVQTYRVAPVRSKPQQPTLALGWLTPPQLLELRVDVSEGKYAQFQLTIDEVDRGRIMQVRRVARDSNKELRVGLNSSALGPGDYMIKIEGYNWRGQTEEVGWLRLGLN